MVPYHYASKLDNVTETVGGARVLRITQELTTLANSLPLSASSSVFIRTDEERLDVMKVCVHMYSTRVGVWGGVLLSWPVLQE